jgi:fructose-6-phosphate aldolase 2
MIREAEAIRNLLGENTFVKIPVTANGLRAIEELAQRDFLITATAILTPTQAMLASEAGATYVAPYVGRCTRSGGDGIQLVKDIDQLFAYGESETAILAASFKTVDDILRVGLSGAEASTISPELLEALIAHPMTDTSIEGFRNDWNSAFGGKPMYDLLG